MLKRENNVIYTNQFAMITFIMLLVFKIAMLPKYLTVSSGNSSWLVVAIMLGIEVVMFCMVYYIVRHIDVTKENKWVIAPIMLLIFLLSNIREIVLFSELLDYTGSTLFDQNKYVFIIALFAPVLAYMLYKGGNSIARMTEGIFYMIILVLIVMVFISDIKIKWDRLLPLMETGGEGLSKGILDHFIWFGEYIPLLFFKVEDNKNKFLNKYSFPLCLVGGFVFVIMFYLSFIGTYGASGELVSFAFNNIAKFNRVSQMLGTVNFVSIVTWLLMSMVELVILLYSCTMSLAYFIRNKNVSIIINVLLIMFVEMYWVQNVDFAYEIATCGVQYYVAAAQYAIPLVLFVYTVIKQVRIKRQNIGMSEKDKNMLQKAVKMDTSIKRIRRYEKEN